MESRDKITARHSDIVFYMDFERTIQDIHELSAEIFSLVKDGKFKESSEKLEKALHMMTKLFYLQPPRNRERIKNELKVISKKFSILKRYFELVWQIETEANQIFSKNISSGSICNRKI